MVKQENAININNFCRSSTISAATQQARYTRKLGVYRRRNCAGKRVRRFAVTSTMTYSRLNRDRDTRLLLLVGECGSKLRSRSVHRGGLACGDARQYYNGRVFADCHRGDREVNTILSHYLNHRSSCVRAGPTHIYSNIRVHFSYCNKQSPKEI